MDWLFANDNVIEESHTGYRIELLNGTWLNPKEIRPTAPEGMNFAKQAQLMREGMAFIEELYQSDSKQLA